MGWWRVEILVVLFSSSNVYNLVDLSCKQHINGVFLYSGNRNAGVCILFNCSLMAKHDMSMHNFLILQTVKCCVL